MGTKESAHEQCIVTQIFAKTSFSHQRAFARQDEDRRPTGDASAGAADAAKASAPARDRTPAGGQDITMGMITAKKAELARVKNDDVVAVDEASGKKAQGKGKGKDKDRRTKDKPGKGSGKGKGKDGKGKDGKKGKAGSRKKASKGS